MRVNPKMAPLRKAFSLPVNSGLNPAPNSSKAANLPFNSTFPLVAVNVPAIICSNVLFPEPFSPIMAKVLPFLTLKLTFLSAQKSR